MNKVTISKEYCKALKKEVNISTIKSIIRDGNSKVIAGERILNKSCSEKDYCKNYPQCKCNTN